MPEYIEREALRNELLAISIDTSNLYGCGVLEGLDRATKRLNSLPAADVAPVVHGRWLDTGCYGESKNPIFVCSECRRGVEDYFIKSHKFCLHCGARMDGDGNG